MLIRAIAARSRTRAGEGLRADREGLTILLRQPGQIFHHATLARTNTAAAGLDEISGIGYFGKGRFSKVLVSADGGESRAEARSGSREGEVSWANEQRKP